MQLFEFERGFGIRQTMMILKILFGKNSRFVFGGDAKNLMEINILHL